MPVLAGMLAGGANGVVAGLLFAPHPGELTRAEIRYMTFEFRDQSSDSMIRQEPL
jgi:gas vesicle protein